MATSSNVQSCSPCDNCIAIKSCLYVSPDKCVLWQPTNVDKVLVPVGRVAVSRSIPLGVSLSQFSKD